MEILQIIYNLPPWAQIGVFTLTGVILFFLGYKIGAFTRSVKASIEKKSLKSEQGIFQKNLKNIYEDEKEKLQSELTVALQKLENLEAKLEDYRKKISGLGILSFSGNQKRADILYSLLLENEALEQLLYGKGDQMLQQQSQHLQEKLIDIKKRQRLISEIFNDETLKNHVREVVEKQTGARVSENSQDPSHQIDSSSSQTEGGSNANPIQKFE